VNGAAPGDFIDRYSSGGTEMAVYLRRLIVLVLLLGGMLPLNASSGEARGIQAEMVLPLNWTPTGAMKARRAYFTLSVLPDGTALAAGGYYHDGSAHYLNSSEIYNPLTNTWAATANSMTTARRNHTATVLLDGRVLVAGGENGLGVTNSAEIYDPATGLWETTGSLNQSRYGHTATRLQDGRVLVVGGCYTNIATYCARLSEIFDPARGVWDEGPILPADEGRMNHSATLLQDGSVLIAGGYRYQTSTLYRAKTYINSFRYFPNDPDGVEDWEPAGAMTAALYGRSEHSAVLSRDNKVLIVGGHYTRYNAISGVYEEGYLTSTEVYDPNEESWSDLSKPLNFGQRGVPAVLDANGNYILLGGEYVGSSSDVYYLDINNAADSWHRLFGNLPIQRSYHAAAVLPGGVILVAGGVDQDGIYQNTAETNRFSTGEYYVADPDGEATKGLHFSSGTLMPNGDILITGGADEYDLADKPCHNVVHRWLHDIDRIDTMPSVDQNMRRARCGHTTTLLPDGRVVVLGGSLTTGGGSSSGAGEIFNGTHWTLLSGPSFQAIRTALLPDGKMLVVQSGGAHPYLFDPIGLTFRETLGDSTGNYSSFTLTLMKNGKVLIVGSLTSDVIEVYDPQTETFTAVDALPARINGHTASLLPDGKVMIAGGRASSSPSLSRSQVYLFDSSDETWETTGSLVNGRFFHSAALLPDGRPVVFGGSVSSSSTTASTSVEIYDLRTRTWSLAGNLNVGRRYHQTIMSLKGKLVSFGGSDNYNESIWNGEEFRLLNVSTSPALWQPTVAAVNCVDCATTRQIEVTGGDFTEAWEGSSGLTNQSAANQPLVQLIRLDNGQMEWLRPGEASTDARFLSESLIDFPAGPVMTFVYVNGSFQAKVGLLGPASGGSDPGFEVYLPMLQR